MKTIFKYQLSAIHEQTIELPLGSKVLSAKEQNGKFVLYALVDSNEKDKEEYSILVYGTGHDINIDTTEYEFLDTLFNDSLVFHFFYKRVK